MTNTSMYSPTTLHTRIGAVVHMDSGEKNDSSAAGAKYFVTFINKTSGHVIVSHMKTKVEAQRLLK